MLKICTDALSNSMNYTKEDCKIFESYFRAVAGTRLSKCIDFNGFLSECGIVVNGADEELTRELYLNCIILMIKSEFEEVQLSDTRAVLIAKKSGCNCVQVSADEVADWMIKAFDLGSSDAEDDIEDDCDEDLDDEYAEEVEDEGSEDDYDEGCNEEDDSEEDKVDDIKEVKEDIKAYYRQYYSGVVSELAKRYTSLFESGYEVISPAGILSRRGLLGLSGNRLVVKKNNIAITSMYNLLRDRMGIVEIESRSNVKIADTIYEYYSNGNKATLYFPNKLVEYAYGRKAPTGDNQDSLNTYEPHASSSNWTAYCNSEVKKSLMAVVSGSVVRYVYSSAKNGEYYNEEIGTGLRSFLKYLEECLSLCLLMVEYKSVSSGYDESLSAIKIRVCDPVNTLGDHDLTKDIINVAFMGATGEVPFSYKPRFENEVFIKEYAHEFNHDSAQAMPLFSYKAYESLKKQGVEPTWDRMILGMFEDGTILVNGKRGVSLNANLTHQICAGSRAGKGVMTLNILISALLSRKNIMYLDRKPDMASMLKSLSPSMFAVNGGAYNPKDDNYGTFSNLDSLINLENIPDYVCESLNLTKSWESLGDIFYMRALKLAIGIIMARGKGYCTRPELGGDNGIMLVVDEFKNFQEGFTGVVRKMLDVLPTSMDLYARTLAEIRKLENKEGTELEVQNKVESLNISYNDGGFYALSFLNSLVEDVKRINELRDASFSPEELSASDIFVIGQSLRHGAIDISKFDDMLKSGRYKSIGRTGLTSGSNNKVDLSRESFAYSLVDFKKSDAFFGRNMEDGRSVYLAQTNNQSKACGRLDDKASNFAYLSSFTDDVRKKIVGGVVSDNLSIANSCVYFKPFLVLNDAVKGDTYTEQMFRRCSGPNPNAPWVTREEIINENSNGDVNDPFLNYAVGFKGYLDMVGASNYSEILESGSSIVNFVVQNCLGYNGDWLSFITDLRPTAIFTVGDVMDGIAYCFSEVKSDDKKPKYLNPMKNPVVEEFRKFNPSVFGASSNNGGYAFDSVSDFMDEELEESVRNEELNIIFEEEEDEEYDIFVDGAENEAEIDLYGYGDDGSMRKPEPKGKSTEDVLTKAGARDEEIAELIRRLNALGVPVSMPKTLAEEEFTKSNDFGKYDFKPAEETTFEKEFEFDGGITSYEDLVDTVTKDVIEKFGGLSQITSFRVKGGAIVVNGCVYKCRLSSLSSNSLPYDLRQELNSGNIGRLFDFRYLRKMPRLRELEFDSTSFVYDYVSYGMGYGSTISVDLFFNDLRSLQSLCIGKKLFNRNNYMEQIRGDDVFYNPRLSTRLADYSEDLLGRFSKSTWAFTKNTMNSKKYGAVVKFLGVTGGLTATGVTKGGQLAVKGGRKLLNGLKSFGQSVKDIIDESKNF